LESIKKEHGAEVDKIVKETYNDLKKLQGEGVNIQTLTQAWEVLQNAGKKIGNLAQDVGADILEKNPQLKEKFGGNLEDLKKMGDQYGPEAKKKVEETRSQVQNIVKGGLGAGSLDQIRKLLEEKVQEVRKMGDQAWDKGLEQAKPFLDKSPKIKEFVEKNKDALKDANLDELWQKVKSAAQSGDVSELEKLAKDKASEAKKGLGNQDTQQYLKMIPGYDEFGSKLQQLQELSEKHGDEAQKLLKEAFEEVRGVLEKKVDQGKKLADEAKKDAK
jgi:CHASE3 domain sensor protein